MTFYILHTTLSDLCHIWTVHSVKGWGVVLFFLFTALSLCQMWCFARSKRARTFSGDAGANDCRKRLYFLPSQIWTSKLRGGTQYQYSHSQKTVLGSACFKILLGKRKIFMPIESGGCDSYQSLRLTYPRYWVAGRVPSGFKIWTEVYITPAKEILKTTFSWSLLCGTFSAQC